MILRRLAVGEFPPHFLYGAAKLGDYGIGVVWHRSCMSRNRLRLMLVNAWRILACREHYDAIYATHYRGIEIIVFLRALRLFRKPIVVWHHQPVIKSPNPLRELVGRLFYKGFDRMFFFSEKLIADSLKSHKAKPEKTVLGHWGMDVPAWSGGAGEGRNPAFTFISTGKELRDVSTLIEAFNRTGAPLRLHINERNGDINYRGLLATIDIRDNINVSFETRLAPYEISRLVDQADCVCICCMPSKYTVGLTTLVEALALGKPVICSRNPQYPFSVDREGCGISVEYGDIEGWTRAITRLRDNPGEAKRMGQRARNLARTRYNDAICAAEAAEQLRSVARRK